LGEGGKAPRQRRRKVEPVRRRRGGVGVRKKSDPEVLYLEGKTAKVQEGGFLTSSL